MNRDLKKNRRRHLCLRMGGLLLAAGFSVSQFLVAVDVEEKETKTVSQEPVFQESALPKQEQSVPPQANSQAWQPGTYPFSRYQKMLSKAPFGKVPVNAPAPVEVEEAPPVEEKQLAIAAVSVVEGKPVVYLIDLKTRAYQKINSEGENASKIKLVEITEASNPRDVVAKVMIDGRLATVKYDMGILDAKPKLASKRKGRVNNRAAPPRPNTVMVQNTAKIQNGSPLSHAQPNATGVQPGPNGGKVVPSAGGQLPVPVVRSIQDQRRLSAVPRRRVIVPGRPAAQP